jgi:hypothetical protein
LDLNRCALDAKSYDIRVISRRAEQAGGCFSFHAANLALDDGVAMNATSGKIAFFLTTGTRLEGVKNESSSDLVGLGGPHDALGMR